jgi:hypothetical protein
MQQYCTVLDVYSRSSPIESGQRPRRRWREVKVHRHTVMLNAVKKAILTPVRLSITPTDLALARRTYSNHTRNRTVQDHNRNLRSTVNLTRRQEAKALHKKREFSHAGSPTLDQRTPIGSQRYTTLLRSQKIKRNRIVHEAVSCLRVW